MEPNEQSEAERLRKVFELFERGKDPFANALSEYWRHLRWLIEAAEDLVKFGEADAERVDPGFGCFWQSWHKPQAMALLIVAKQFESCLLSESPRFIRQLA